MKLGAFSISLTVKDIHASLKFYEALGFISIGGNVADKWLILKNGSTVIGLFEGVFDRNMLTFNPGWDEKGENLEEFTDIRELQKQLKDKGIALSSEADESSTGPTSFMLFDPDGNPILFDQHR